MRVFTLRTRKVFLWISTVLFALIACLGLYEIAQHNGQWLSLKGLTIVLALLVVVINVIQINNLRKHT